MEHEKSNCEDSLVVALQNKYFKYLVKENVITFLPAKALAKLSCVSKEWNQWITTPLFAYRQSCCFKQLSGFFCQKQFQNPTFVSLDASAYGVPRPFLDFLPENVDIASSCSGLLLCHGRGYDKLLYYICNPANKHWTALPQPDLYHGFDSRAILAFEPSPRNMEGNYRLICAVPLSNILYFEVYYSADKFWTILSAASLEMEDLNIKHNGFYMKGVAYWLTNSGKVIAFHVDEEVLEVIPIPDRSSDGVLTQFRGELCYIRMSFISGNTYCIRICGGMEMELKHDLRVSLGEASDELKIFKALPCFDGEKVMILFDDGIYSFDINDGILQEITRGIGYQSASADKHIAYVNSMVQLH